MDQTLPIEWVWSKGISYQTDYLQHGQLACQEVVHSDTSVANPASVNLTNESLIFLGMSAISF